MGALQVLIMLKPIDARKEVRKMKQKSETIYQIKIKLLNFKPWIWRRVLVPGRSTLRDLHQIIQAAMPWDGGHLHQFIIGQEHYGPSMAEIGGDWGEEIFDEKKFTLDKLALPSKSKLRYEYDFGDDWVHEINVEKIIAQDSDQFYPVCMAGENAAPPDDCGGVWGYGELLEILADPKNPEHKNRQRWLGEKFDPTKFNIDEANQNLRSLFQKRLVKKTKSQRLNQNLST
jgi:Plasmid pRiA4b ORF-3-like protein